MLCRRATTAAVACGSRVPLRTGLHAQATAVGRNAATLAAALHSQAPGGLALAAPAQGIEWTYGELSRRVSGLAGGLSKMGYARGDVVATDLASTAENLVLQLAASHLGVAVLCLKDIGGLGKFGADLRVRGAVATSAGSFLAEADLPLPRLFVEPSAGELAFADVAGEAPAASDDSSAPLGYYSSASPLTNGAALAAGTASREKLGMTEKDVVLVSITLNHVFGIGSGVCAALQSGATVVLPDASGVVGCGSPSQRAIKTLEYLDALGCTLLYADTHTHKALIAESPAPLKSLRGGICKVGSGTTFLEGTVELSGVSLHTMGKA